MKRSWSLCTEFKIYLQKKLFATLNFQNNKNLIRVILRFSFFVDNFLFYGEYNDRGFAWTRCRVWGDCLRGRNYIGDDGRDSLKEELWLFMMEMDLHRLLTFNLWQTFHRCLNMLKFASVLNRWVSLKKEWRWKRWNKTYITKICSAQINRNIKVVVSILKFFQKILLQFFLVLWILSWDLINWSFLPSISLWAAPT